MSIRFETAGFDRLVDKLGGELRTRYGEAKRVSVVTGYATPYALAVHENMEMKLMGEKRYPNPPSQGNYWDAIAGQGRSKFLETPARVESPRLASIVVDAMLGGSTFQAAIFEAGLALQAFSQELVPYDLGPLFNSAFTEIET